MIGEEQPGRDRNPRTGHGEHTPSRGEASLRYGLQILGLFSSTRRWLRIGEIADELGLSPSDAQIQVSAMRRMQLVQEVSGCRYGLGVGPSDLGMNAIRSAGIARHARAHLAGLCKLTGLPVALALYDGTELLANRSSAPYVEGAEDDLELTIELDRCPPAHATALGKVLAAYLPEHHEYSLVQALELESYTQWSITDKQVLLKHLHRVRSQGMAIEDREHMPDGRWLAVPVRSADRCVVAALGLAMSDMDTPMTALADVYGILLTDTATALGATLRHAPIHWP